jgi:alkanesulfonate monooxygenase SsuD/methylene tetrahydromethanopterin reductase-like flavin-dependent oxidoreductase (luciferase family)
MRLGLALPHYGFSLGGGEPITPEVTLSWARTAESLGFDSVWVSDHLFYSFGRYGADPAPIASLEALTTLAGVAAVTTRLRIGTLVLCDAFRDARLLARQATTLDAIAHGRLDLGLGAGWLEDEFRAFGLPYGSVGERFAGLEATLGFLAGDDGPGVPLWLGGKGGPRLLRLAARYGAGWNTVWRVDPDVYAGKLADIRAVCEREGRDPSTFRLSVGLYGMTGDDEAAARAAFERGRAAFPGGSMDADTWETWRADTLSGTPEQVRERVAAFEALGVEEIVLSPWVLPFALVEPEQVERFATALGRG